MLLTWRRGRGNLLARGPEHEGGQRGEVAERAELQQAGAEQHRGDGSSCKGELQAARLPLRQLPVVYRHALELFPHQASQPLHN